jgi:protein TonB
MSTVSFRQFSRPHLPAQSDNQTRIAGGLLTAVLYAVLAFIALWSLNHVPVPAVTREITASLLPDARKKPVLEPPLLAPLIRPRAENLAPPVITIAPAPFTASAAATSPLAGGLGGASGTGSGGNGGITGACLDAAWMRAVSERVRQFFTYPPAALAVRKTGLVMVHFQVRRDGQIEKLEISRSSGDEGLDKAAMDMMRKAQPLPPIPDRMHTDRVDGELPINFGVRSYNGSTTTGTCG